MQWTLIRENTALTWRGRGCWRRIFTSRTALRSRSVFFTCMRAKCTAATCEVHTCSSTSSQSRLIMICTWTAKQQEHANDRSWYVCMYLSSSSLLCALAIFWCILCSCAIRPNCWFFRKVINNDDRMQSPVCAFLSQNVPARFLRLQLTEVKPWYYTSPDRTKLPVWAFFSAIYPGRYNNSLVAV